MEGSRLERMSTVQRHRLLKVLADQTVGFLLNPSALLQDTSIHTPCLLLQDNPEKLFNRREQNRKLANPSSEQTEWKVRDSSACQQSRDIGLLKVLADQTVGFSPNPSGLLQDTFTMSCCRTIRKAL
ncbi:hypothetical protein CEXT_702941 [Caerostris extrusa]|uniref:Uncharacterized protein n=1 Tax=Caerostris extrusa TaxID=172846 RepID=A0AAV4WCP8_CAEEX|nr:hypothetical protein CEXT_702941 [Caerostris extrusa]